MNLGRIQPEEEAAVEAGRAKLPSLAERLRGEATQLGELRRSLPLPEERVLSAIYESETSLKDFPAVAFAMDLEFLENSLCRLAGQVEQTAQGRSPEDQGDDPLR